MISWGLFVNHYENVGGSRSAPRLLVDPRLYDIAEMQLLAARRRLLTVHIAATSTPTSAAPAEALSVLPNSQIPIPVSLLSLRLIEADRSRVFYRLGYGGF
ncbi:jg13890 [Pararge aegeria aegeria]|uniref:Jg13890 protein n=1 Tax=Pararge aegeria aegeria TaxID=348720 RepID=A0A8S4S4M1_9NEOP|nr:jg13890 [Pararge aegeria aegeria]